MSEHEVTNERHRSGCAECAAVWADLERISREARVLPTLSPSRDLWSGIESRLTSMPGQAAGEAPRRRRFFGAPAVRLAAAASLLVAATATLTWQLATRSDGIAAGDGPTIGGFSVAAADGSEASLYRTAAFDADFGVMNREIRSLESLVATQRDQLDPSTIAVLERNLALIDRAIAESRAAFLKDPASRFLATQLNRSYASKLTLLRDMAQLSTGI